MQFTTKSLQELASAWPDEVIDRAEMANVLVEEKPSSGRLGVYEREVAASPTLDQWRQQHQRYVTHFVRGGNGLDPATFTSGEPALSQLEGNQFVLRVEELNRALITDGLLADDHDLASATAAAGQVNAWIDEWRASHAGAGRPEKVASLAELGKLTGVARVAPTAGAARLAGLTDLLNGQRSDRRPSFVAFDAELSGITTSADWVEELCRRCGLAHHYAGHPKVLALFRYRAAYPMESHRGRPVFAAPTVLDQPFSAIFFPGPLGDSTIAAVQTGHAVSLEPSTDCTHLAAELVHARIDYRLEDWVKVGVLVGRPVDDARIPDLRKKHLQCVQSRSKRPDYGATLP